MSEHRRIAHLDMDAFFASVELLRYPHLKGQAVVVGGRSVPAPWQDDKGNWHHARLRQYAGRGVVTTSTYEARAHGVFSGMGLMQSARLAPEAILLPADFEAYRHHSRLFKSAVRSIAPLVEDRGIDEIYIDLTESDVSSVDLARQIKQAVRDATGLSCSIAVAPNKLLAKIGSDLDKPDGLTILDMPSFRERIWPLSVSKVNGIGPKATARLKENGIHTIGELAETPVDQLISLFGASTGNWMFRIARGQDDRPVLTHSDPKSISRETTFSRDLDVRLDRTELTSILDQLCERLSEDLQRKQVFARTIGIKVKFADFKVVTRDVTLTKSIGQAMDLRRAASECLRRISWTDRIRLLGVRASGLSGLDAREPDQLQLSLW
ncbi:DNA polymerase IV [Orrella marina]|uniref:DNA polymerase IV n=1 Tax=Orrella marina TaxID=2163011 RepID=A0A2R4XLB9_9BURK|nr:DNA polymerase IV [Orrella marina]AWB34600.1 DNA polymerase IV [Orrella marina]